MSTPRAHALPWLLALLLAPAAAWCEPQQARGPFEGHQLSAFMGLGGSVYLSQARTMGGLGASVGVRDTVHGRWLLQAEVGQLVALGNVTALRLGAGVQLQGLYSPAVLLTVDALLGDRLAFFTPEHPAPLRGPAVSLGVLLAPLRFSRGPITVSLLQAGLGAGSDLPGLGLHWHLGLTEIALALP